MTTTNRLMEVHRMLGSILSNPAAFGLGEQAPRPLLDVLTFARHELMKELTEQESYREDEEDTLEAELSQDADTVTVSGRK